MRRRFKRVGRFATTAALVLICAGLGAVASLAGPARPVDTEPPIVLVLPSEGVEAGGFLTIRAQVVDPSGPGRTLVWVRGEHDTDFRKVAMQPRGRAELVAKLQPWATRGALVAYYLEAYDKAGNGPTFSAGPRTPFVVRLSPRETGTAAASDAGATDRRAPKGVAIAGGLLVLALLLLRRPSRSDGELQRRVIVDLDRLARATPTPVESETSSVVEWATLSLQEQDFWVRMLSPLVDMSRSEREQALETLSARPHYHPTQGKRFFDRRFLLHQLEALRAEQQQARIDPASTQVAPPEALADPAAQDADPPSGPLPGQRGASMAELVVVVGLVGLGLGIAATSLRSMEAPLRTSGEMVESLIRYSRARAMSSTTPHRVRPISPSTLVVESGSSCTSGPWVVDPAMKLELPGGVTLSDSAWSVCFTSRGLAQQNFIVTLQQQELGSQQLEILLGGSVKWLP